MNGENGLLSIENAFIVLSTEASHGGSTDSFVSTPFATSPNRKIMIIIAKELKELNQGMIQLNGKIDKIFVLDQVITSFFVS